MQPDEPGAILMLVDEQRTFIDQNTHDFLVIHKTASGGSAQNIANFFAHDPAMASTHYIVGQDGIVVQAVLEKDGAGGNCCLENGHASFLPLGVNLNVRTVSIEHVDPASDNSTPLTNAQKAASFRLVQHICERHNIPKRRATNDGQGGIIGHNDIAPINRARCPGNYPWQELFDYLEHGGNVTIDLNNADVAAHFDAAGTNQWKCKQTGKIIQYGILGFYRKYGNDALCGLTHLGLPVSNEISIAGVQGAVKQHFERGVLFYDQNHAIDNPPGSGSVYLAHLYSGPGQDPRVAELTAKIADLEKQLAANPGNVALQQALDAANAKLAQIKALVA